MVHVPINITASYETHTTLALMQDFYTRPPCYRANNTVYTYSVVEIFINSDFKRNWQDMTVRLGKGPKKNYFLDALASLQSILFSQ